MQVVVVSEKRNKNKTRPTVEERKEEVTEIDATAANRRYDGGDDEDDDAS